MLAGCRCPLVANQYGLGVPGGGMFGQPRFVIEPRCRAHGAGSGWSYNSAEPPAEDVGRERVLLAVHPPERVRERKAVRG